MPTAKAFISASILLALCLADSSASLAGPRPVLAPGLSRTTEHVAAGPIAVQPATIDQLLNACSDPASR